MKSVIALSMLVASALAAATPPLSNSQGDQNSQENQNWQGGENWQGGQNWQGGSNWQEGHNGQGRPWPGPPLRAGYVTLQFSDDLSSTPNPINVPFAIGGGDTSVVVDPTRKASSVQVVDQSHAPNGFQCFVRITGQGEVTHHVDPINTFRSFGSSVRFGNIFVRCTR